MAGLGYRREMADWDMSAVDADFFEVAPENWLRRDTGPLHELRASGRPVQLHGVSLNLGGTAPIDAGFVRSVRSLMAELDVVHYSDHLAASGDTHHLYDLFPVPFTRRQALRVADRISAVQDLIGQRIGVENTTWYTNIGDMAEPEFLSQVLERADCNLLLDLNNIDVNHKNHGGLDVESFLARVDLSRVSYMHVAGHEFDARFGLFIDTHSQGVQPHVARLARQIHNAHGKPVLLEWDNDVPGVDVINRELSCLRTSTATCAA
jgi:uncharacterized protein (UPF0276 family)